MLFVEGIPVMLNGVYFRTSAHDWGVPTGDSAGPDPFRGPQNVIKKGKTLLTCMCCVLLLNSNQDPLSENLFRFAPGCALSA